MPLYAATPTGDDPGSGLTVDEIARRAGTTTRNVRALQTLGLLPRPALRGRTGLYGGHHLDRLTAILRLQRGGFSLGAIASLFEAWEAGWTLEQVLGLPPATSGPGAADDGDELSAFRDWPVRRQAHGVAVVPTTLLAPAAS